MVSSSIPNTPAAPEQSSTRDGFAMPRGCPTVSCIISNYNYEAYVAQAIESALAQTVPFDRIIVVDDGSTDGSRALLRKFGDRIELIETPNQGQTGACLAGFFRQPGSEYVYFLDADDYLPDYFVERVQSHLQARPVKLQFQLSTVSEQLKAFEALFPTYPTRYGSREMVRDNEIIGYYRSPPTSGNVVRADALAGLDLALLDKRAAIDGTLNLIMPYLGEVVSVNEPLAFRRVHTSNLGQWSRPTVELLGKEIAVFHKSWEEAKQLLAWDNAHFDGQKPLYVVEREMMIAALQGRVPWPSFQFARTVLRTAQPVGQRLMLAGWAMLLLLPHRPWQAYLVAARRSPHNRSRGLEAVVRTVLAPGRNLGLGRHKPR